MSDPKAQARDLDADLAICEAAAPRSAVATTGYVFRNQPNYVFSGGVKIAEFEQEKEADFFVEACAGWPYAIKRAITAESEADSLRNELRMLQEQFAQLGVLPG